MTRRKTPLGFQYFNVEIKERSGIYAVINKINKHHYVGQSIDMEKRRLGHMAALKKGEHDNRYLQNAFNMYGASAFAFTVLEYVPRKEDLNEREQYWIDELAPIYGLYNIEMNVGEIAEEAEYLASQAATGNNRTQKDDPHMRPLWHQWVYGGGRNPLKRN